MAEPVATAPKTLPPVLGRMLTGTFWLALRTPLQAVLALWKIPLILSYIGKNQTGAYNFAWGFGFLQFLLEFGMSSALQRQVSDAWTRGDRQGVRRAISAGMSFYAVMAVVQAAVLLVIAYAFVPRSDFRGSAADLVLKLLWLQALTAPCYGLSTVVSSVVQAARRYDFIPRCEMAIVILHFLVLVGGVLAKVDFFYIVIAQTAVQVLLSLGPGLWVMVHELGYFPNLRGATLADFQGLLHISFYVFLIQLSVVLSTNIDTTILGFALSDPGEAVAKYTIVSKPFAQIRQTGWMLAYLVMPAVASLAAANDQRGLDRMKYDVSRFHIALLVPIAFLAWIYAQPFLELWVGHLYPGPGQVEELAWLMRLFLIATLPLLISVHVQMSIGTGHVKVIALSALCGSLINLPISYYLALQIGVAGVIWGTVLTTLFSNLLIPGIRVFEVLHIRSSTIVTRTLLPPLFGVVMLVLFTAALRFFAPPITKGPTLFVRLLPLLLHLSLGCLAYAAGYLTTPTGRQDLRALIARVQRSDPAL